MKKIAKIVFKIHRLLFKYPTRSEVRLVLQEKLPDIGLTWYAAMLYICGQPIKEVAEDLYMDEQEVKAMLNNLVKDLKL